MEVNYSGKVDERGAENVRLMSITSRGQASSAYTEEGGRGAVDSAWSGKKVSTREKHITVRAERCQAVKEGRRWEEEAKMPSDARTISPITET